MSATRPTDRQLLDDLSQRTDFLRRHVGPNEAEVGEMLATVGVASLDELIDLTVPATIRELRDPEVWQRVHLAYWSRLPAASGRQIDEHEPICVQQFQLRAATVLEDVDVAGGEQRESLILQESDVEVKEGE